MTQTHYLDAVHFKNYSGRPPIWLMRQAGRYMASYRAIRQNYSFIEMMGNPKVARDITLLPIRELGVDAAILFSDILVVLPPLGADLSFHEGVGPVIASPVRTATDAGQLKPFDVADCDFVVEEIQLIQAELKPQGIPLIGFAGAPFTVASYLIEGRGSSDLKETKKMMFSLPDVFHDVMNRLTKATIDYLCAQIKAGVNAVQLFDTWANHLSAEDARAFNLPYVKTVISEVKKAYPQIPVTYFSKGMSGILEDVADLGMDVLSVDWTHDLPALRAQFPRLALQGNLDPFVLYASSDVVKQRVGDLLSKMGRDPGFIFNLGHGLLPDIPYERVKDLVHFVRTWE